MADAPGGEVLVYETPEGDVRVDVRLERETVWLRQDQMSRLFGRERSVVTKHVRNVFREGELDPKSVCANFAHTAADGKTYQVEHYNLDVIISVGYRVKSAQGTRLRQWATRTLRDHHDQLFGAFSRCLDPPPSRLRPLAFCIEQDHSMSGLRNLTFGRS
jgi:hypothetical protein